MLFNVLPLFLLVLIFLGVYLLTLELPHKFINNAYSLEIKSRLEDRFDTIAMFITACGFLLVMRGGKIHQGLMALLSVAAGRGLITLAKLFAQHTLRRRFVNNALRSWQSKEREEASKIMLCLNVLGSDRVLSLHEEYVIFPLGRLPQEAGAGFLLDEVRRVYPQNVLHITKDGELQVRIVHEPVPLKHFMSAVRGLPKFNGFRILVGDELVVLT